LKIGDRSGEALTRRPIIGLRRRPPASGRRTLAAAVLCGAGVLFGAGTATADVRLPEGPGANVVYAKCQTCHSLQYVTDSKGLLPNQWRSVVAGMKDYGLTATDEETKQILTYLTTYMGPNPPPAAKAPAEKQGGTADGATVFAQNCASCHGAKGTGQPGYFPPLAGNTDLSQDTLFPVMVVLHGLNGPITVNGDHYNGSMPPFGHLSDVEIAAVVNFVRGAWGNSPAGTTPVTPEMVAQQRKHDMTPADVHKYRSGMKH
jgi:mono/diheme cytochrome c family protein